jgi:predicted Zn-dependent protease
VIFAIVGLGILAFIVAEARGPAGRMYNEWRERRAIKQAKGFIEKKDVNNALLALQVAAQANPNNPAAWRVAADVLESNGSNQAVRLRQQIVSAVPHSLADRLALAATALRFRDLQSAEVALSGVAAADQNKPEFLKLSAALAFASKRTEDAEATIDRLLAVEPNDAKMKFNRAVLRLRHVNRALADESREQLTAIALKPGPLQADALRELTRDEAARNRPAPALAWAEKLAGLPGAPFDDQLLRINLLRLANQALLTTAAENSLAERALKDPAEAAQFATWLTVQGRAREARPWLANLPAAVRADPRVRTVEAECLAALGDWNALAEALQAGAWGPVAPETIRLALSARTLSDRQRADLRRDVWQEAIKLTRRDAAGLRVLLRLSLYWNWTTEAEDTLFATASNFPTEVWALNALVSSAYTRKDTATLKKAYSLWHDIQPQSPKVTGDWVMVTLLLEPSPLETKAKIAARDLARAEPRNAFFVTTHAFSLYQQGRRKEALDLMEHLSPAELRVPGRALYYGLILAADGQLERADNFLKLTAKADLLPEERELLRTAQAIVAGAPVPDSARKS